MKREHILKMVMLAMLVAIGVVISPILRVEGMCPMAHLSGGKILCAVLGEVFGTGVIGALASYPVMTYIVGREGLTWAFYIPSFIGGTLIGGSIAFVFLMALRRNGLLAKFQHDLGAKVYDTTAEKRAAQSTK